MLVGMGVMLAADTRLAVGVVGLLLFLLGYEYGFVTSFSLISEAMPDSKGSTLALGNAVATLARGTGVIISGWLFGRYGIAGAIALSGGAALISAGCLLLSRRAS
jgi:predicted MFS family arabinose efflux permease